RSARGADCSRTKRTRCIGRLYPGRWRPLIRAREQLYSVPAATGDGVPEDVRRDSFENEGSGEKSTTRVLVMLAVLVSLVAVLRMVQVREKKNQAVLWPTAPFEAGVAVQRVVFHPVDGSAT